MTSIASGSNMNHPNPPSFLSAFKKTSSCGPDLINNCVGGGIGALIGGCIGANASNVCKACRQKR